MCSIIKLLLFQWTKDENTKKGLFLFPLSQTFTFPAFVELRNSKSGKKQRRTYFTFKRNTFPCSCLITLSKHNTSHRKIALLRLFYSFTDGKVTGETSMESAHLAKSCDRKLWQKSWHFIIFFYFIFISYTSAWHWTSVLKAFGPVLLSDGNYVG